jgi:hypothetical protein
MFSNNNDSNLTIENPSNVEVECKEEPQQVSGKYKSILSNPNLTTLYSNQAISSDKIDTMLEKEKQHNKTESWNKLDKTQKIQKLHTFAEKYIKDNKLSHADMKMLKHFFVECLEKNKLQKAKEITYDKDSQEISSVPSLFYHSINRNFTLRVVDPKRVSTLKSLTPKKTKQNETEEKE